MLNSEGVLYYLHQGAICIFAWKIFLIGESESLHELQTTLAQQVDRLPAACRLWR